MAPRRHCGGCTGPAGVMVITDDCRAAIRDGTPLPCESVLYCERRDYQHGHMACDAQYARDSSAGTTFQVGQRALGDILAAVLEADTPQCIEDVQAVVPLSRKRISWGLKYWAEQGRLHSGQVRRGGKWLRLYHCGPVADERESYERRIAELAAYGVSHSAIAAMMGTNKSFVYATVRMLRGDVQDDEEAS